MLMYAGVKRETNCMKETGLFNFTIVMPLTICCHLTAICLVIIALYRA